MLNRGITLHRLWNLPVLCIALMQTIIYINVSLRKDLKIFVTFVGINRLAQICESLQRIYREVSLGEIPFVFHCTYKSLDLQLNLTSPGQNPIWSADDLAKQIMFCQPKLIISVDDKFSR